MAFSVGGKTAIVTGAGSGICFSFAQLLLRRNCNVVLADLKLRPEAESLLNDKKSGGRAIFQRTDVTKWKELERMFKVAESEFGGADIVCPGAGVYEPVSLAYKAIGVFIYRLRVSLYTGFLEFLAPSWQFEFQG